MPVATSTVLSNLASDGFNVSHDIANTPVHVSWRQVDSGDGAFGGACNKGGMACKGK